MLAARMLKKVDGKLPRWIEDWVDRGSGKKLQIDESDLWIAAVATERDLTVITGDGDMRTLARSAEAHHAISFCERFLRSVFAYGATATPGLRWSVVLDTSGRRLERSDACRVNGCAATDGGDSRGPQGDSMDRSLLCR